MKKMIIRNNFTYVTRQKGKTFGAVKITNNSNYIVLYNDHYVGEVRTKTDAEKFIANLIKYQKLEYTQEY